MPLRKSFWMYDYDQVKYRTPLQWGMFLILSVLLGVFGCFVLWFVVADYKAHHSLAFGLAGIVAICLGLAVIELPASLLFFFRRQRGEISGYFDYEVLDADESDEVDNGPDHR